MKFTGSTESCREVGGNLVPVFNFSSFCPVVDLLVDNMMNIHRSRLLLATGRGCGSALRILRSGVAVKECVFVDLPGSAGLVFTLRSTFEARYERYLVVSFSSSTMVMMIANGAVNQVLDSGVLTDVSTFAMKLMQDDSIIQVSRRGIHHVFRGRLSSGWSVPASRDVQKVCCNSRQVVLVLKGDMVVYLELGFLKHGLEELGRKQYSEGISSLDIMVLSPGSKRSVCFALSTSTSFVYLVSLSPCRVLERLLEYRLETSIASSISFIDSKKVGVCSELIAGCN